MDYAVWIEEMRYTIYSVDDSRFQYIMKLQSQVRSWEEVHIECVDGRNPDELRRAIDQHGTIIHKADIRVGQLGVWHTFLNALKAAPLVTFDDDVLLCDNFQEEFQKRFDELPEDADFFSLFLPRDSDHMASPSDYLGSYLTKAYARYGGASFYFSEKGAAKILELVERDGIRMQYDDQLYSYVKAGELNGYSSRPDLKDLVFITGRELSIAQGTEIYSV